MPLPAPNLDDRRFQDLVDESKRLVQQRCPEWTDHNVSDPGVTLIETFAYMTDIVLYRLNRVPERHYIKFLELIGVKLFAPTAAKLDVTFWLAGPVPELVRIAPATQVATRRTDTEDAVVFTTNEALEMPPVAAMHLRSSVAAGELRDHDSNLDDGREFYCFDQTPKPGDILYVGLSEAAPACLVTLRFTANIDGIGVDPTEPPLAWEAWSGRNWVDCELENDATGGLNRDGDVVVQLPKDHQVSVLDSVRAGWIRARVTPTREGQPAYSASPRIRSVRAFTIGGTVEATEAETIENELLGVSDGVPGQRFSVQRPPIVAGEVLALQVSSDEDTVSWTAVPSFAGSGPTDPHFVVDASAGEIQLGPAVREEDGSLRQYGAVPPKGAVVCMAKYSTGGGQRGNVAAGTVTVLKSAIPFVQRVTNRRAASGGVDGEDLEAAKVRGPIMLRTRNRAVTTEDYEQLSREAAPEVARVRAVTVEADQGGGVRVLVVPAVAHDELRRLPFEQLVPDEDTLRRIADHLDQRRTVGARVVVEPPRYQGITVVVRVRARSRFAPDRLRDECLHALYGYFHPVVGGPDASGWPFGRPVHVGEVYSVLQKLAGVELLEDARLFAADPITGDRGRSVQHIELDANELVFSFEHQVLVDSS